MINSPETNPLRSNPLRALLPPALMALAVYIGGASLAIIAGLSAGLSATSRMALYHELSPWVLGETVRSAEPGTRWLLEPVMYHVETLLTSAAWFAYTHKPLITTYQPFIEGFFQYVVPLVMAGLAGTSVYLALKQLDDNGQATRTALRLVGWWR